MRILRGTEQIDKARWLAFVDSHPDGYIFNTPQLLETFEKSNYYRPSILIALDGDVIAGLLAWNNIRDYSGPLQAFTSRNIVWASPLVRDNNPDIARILLREYMQVAKREAI